MSRKINRQFLLNSRPVGEVKLDDFKYQEVEVPTPADGEVLIAVRYLALEPAMRGWMENRADYVAPLLIGDLMRGNGGGEVIESRNPDYPVGTRVLGSFGWQTYAVSDGKAMPLVKLDKDIEFPVAIGVLGITGLTAWFGIHDIGKPQAGETVLVSGAAGATGSVAGQLAKLAGCRVVGIAGSAGKCRWLCDELGFDAAINYRDDDVAKQIRQHCPDGINIYYDNVGGDLLDMALANLADRARIVLCGGISRYNSTVTPAGPKNYFNLIFRRARMEGFIVLDYVRQFAAARQQLTQLLAEGKLKHAEDVLQGFEQMPAALLRLFHGKNTGKQMVKITDSD